MASAKIPVSVELLEREGVQIYRMATLDLHGKPWMYVCSYLIDGVLIDCGHHHAKNKFLKELNINEVEAVLITHHHEDHIGACHDITTKFNVPVFANKETIFLARSKIRIPPERKLVWGVPIPPKIKEFPNYNTFDTKKADFKLIPSPGHCNNLISFYHEKRRLLFSTDAFINSQQSVIFNWEDANQILGTLNYFKTLNFKYIFLEDGSLAKPKDLDDLINFWTDLKVKSQKLYDSGISTRQIVKRIFGRESILKQITGGDISRENLIRSLLKLPTLDFRKSRKKRGHK